MLVRLLLVVGRGRVVSIWILSGGASWGSVVAGVGSVHVVVMGVRLFVVSRRTKKLLNHMLEKLTGPGPSGFTAPSSTSFVAVPFAPFLHPNPHLP